MLAEDTGEPLLAPGAAGFGQLDSDGNSVLDRAELEQAPPAALEAAFPGFGVGEVYIQCKVRAAAHASATNIVLPPAINVAMPGADFRS